MTVEKEVGMANGNSTSTTSEAIHYLPMKIDYNGTVNVKEKFVSAIRQNGEVLETEFRGYPLKGKELNLPLGYVGVVTQPTVSLLEEKKIKPQQIFKQMTYWNYDQTPSGMDSCVKVMDWAELAQKLHGRQDES